MNDFAVRIASGCLSLFMVIGVMVPSGHAAPVDSARDIFKTAYENRYTWDNQFPGYQAEVSVNYSGALEQGLVRVKPDLSIETFNLENEEIEQIVRSELQMEIIHRRNLPFDEVHPQSTFEIVGADDDGALEIQELGDDVESRYKVRDRKIVQVNRGLDDVAVTVNTLGWITPQAGYLPVHYQTIFRNPHTGEVIQREDIRDFHEKIGNYYLLTKRGIRYGDKLGPKEKPLADIWIRFNDIQPL
ncbi:MAG: DUF3386 family protein [Elainellaceae cyanobacterium]